MCCRSLRRRRYSFVIWFCGREVQPWYWKWHWAEIRLFHFLWTWALSLGVTVTNVLLLTSSGMQCLSGEAAGAEGESKELLSTIDSHQVKTVLNLGSCWTLYSQKLQYGLCRVWSRIISWYHMDFSRAWHPFGYCFCFKSFSAVLLPLSSLPLPFGHLLLLVITSKNYKKLILTGGKGTLCCLLHSWSLGFYTCI